MQNRNIAQITIHDHQLMKQEVITNCNTKFSSEQINYTGTKYRTFTINKRTICILGNVLFQNSFTISLTQKIGNCNVYSILSVRFSKYAFEKYITCFGTLKQLDRTRYIQIWQSLHHQIKRVNMKNPRDGKKFLWFFVLFQAQLIDFLLSSYPNRFICPHGLLCNVREPYSWCAARKY